MLKELSKRVKKCFGSFMEEFSNPVCNKCSVRVACYLRYRELHGEGIKPDCKFGKLISDVDAAVLANYL